MHNWTVDTNQLKKDPEQYKIWRLEQLVNFGLDGQKLTKHELKKNWSELKLDPLKKAFLKMLLWP